MCVGEANLEDVQVCVECLKGGGCRYWKSAYFRKSAWVCDCVVRMWYVFVFLARSFSVTEKKINSILSLPRSNGITNFWQKKIKWEIFNSARVS